MGLTIHYEFAASGSADEVKQQVRALRRLFSQLDVEVGHVHHCTDLVDEAGYGLEVRDDRDYWRQALTTAFTGVKRVKRVEQQSLDGTSRGRLFFEPTRAEVAADWEGIALPVYVMPGCEPFEVVLGRKRDTAEWYGKGFTKTQYADRFYKAHLLVCKMLDLCADIGILDDVADEGHYYETRDFRQLECSITEYKQLVEQIGAALQQAAGDDVAIYGSWDQTTADLDINRLPDAPDADHDFAGSVEEGEA